ncbi:FAD-dependent oxidoreductase [Brevibacterium album]|uniref:FAD-dependent oxidoreductase n=1 Tax=Brevibacterium album TaxID=417948 RepID=UPI00040EF202|nr:FAD-dependent oxidoreductase [Brevibacterium album]
MADSGAATVVIAGGGAAGRAAAGALVAGLAESRSRGSGPGIARIVHLTGPAAEAIDRTMVDKALMTGRLTPERAVSLRPPVEGVETRDAHLLRVEHTGEGTGSAAPLRLVLSGGEVLDAAALIVATGSAPRTLDVPGAADWREAGRLTSLHSAADALRIRGLVEAAAEAQSRLRVIVSGTGLVGSEAAGLLSGADCEVTLVSRSAVPGAEVLGEPIARALADAHSAAVDARWGARIASLDAPPAGGAPGAVRLDDGTRLEAGLVIAAHGAEPLLPLGLEGLAGEARKQEVVSAAHGTSAVQGTVHARSAEAVQDTAAARGAEGAQDATASTGAGGDVLTRVGFRAARGLPVDGSLRVMSGSPGLPIWAAGAVAAHAGRAEGFGEPGADDRWLVDHWDDAEAQGAHAARAVLAAFSGADAEGALRADAEGALHTDAQGAPRARAGGDGHRTAAAGAGVRSAAAEAPGSAGRYAPYVPTSAWFARIHGRQLAGFGAVRPGLVPRTVSEEPLLVEFADPRSGRVEAVVGLDAGRALRAHARTTVLLG